MTSKRPVVIVIHGMSTTAESMQAGWSDETSDEDGFDRVYWRLPVLREGRACVMARRDEDLFRNLFYAVVSTSRSELRTLVSAFAPRPVALLGFSIGGLISLWGAADNAEVRAAVAIGGVPHLEYLLHYFPDYDFTQVDVVEMRQGVNLSQQRAALRQKPTLILHGEQDEQALIHWMLPFAQALHADCPTLHSYITYPNVQHRLTGESAEEEVDLVALRVTATAWLKSHLV